MLLTTSSKALPKVGGGTVEVIKIGTANGGGAGYARTDSSPDPDSYSFNGSGSFTDGKTLSEVLNGKKVVSFAFDFETDNSFFVKGAFVGVGNGSRLMDLRIAQDSADSANVTSFNVFANVGVSGNDKTPSGKPLTVYAICI